MRDTWNEQRRALRAHTKLASIEDTGLIAAYLELLVWEGNDSEALRELDTLKKGWAEGSGEEFLLTHQMTRATVLGGRASERAAAVARALAVYGQTNRGVAVPYLVELTQALLKRGKPPELLTATETLMQLAGALSYEDAMKARIGAIEPLVRLEKQEEVTKIRRELVPSPQHPFAVCGFQCLVALLSALQRVGQAREVATLVEATLTQLQLQLRGPLLGITGQTRQWLVGLAPFAQDRGNQQRLRVLVEAIRQEGEKPERNLGPIVTYWGATTLLLSGRSAQALEWMQGLDQTDYGTQFCWLHAATLLQKRQGQALARLTRATLERVRRERPSGNKSALKRARLGEVLLQLGDEPLARRVLRESLDDALDEGTSVRVGLRSLQGTLLTKVGMLKESLPLLEEPEFQEGVFRALRRSGKERAKAVLALAAPQKTPPAFRARCEALAGHWQAAQATATALPTEEARLEAYVFLLREHLRQTNATFRKDGPTGEPAWPDLYLPLMDDRLW